MGTFTQMITSLGMPNHFGADWGTTRKEISPCAIVGRQSDQHLPAHNFVVVGGIVGVVDDCDGVNVSLQGRRSEVLFGIQLHCNCSGSMKRKHIIKIKF